jgi:DNA repair exonuclease SbcCD ATPase subunit
MKYVNFKRLAIKNFLSVGEEPVVVEFNSGLNIITGHNKDKLDRRNGVGKSTVADAVYFAIFGSTLRELKKDFIVNNIIQRNCEVCLNFTVNVDGVECEYKLIRRLAPSKCLLYRDGEDITRDSISNTTHYLCDLLHTTPEVFQNCVIMTVNNVIPFMAKKKLEKRKFIEGIFNLQVFSNMLNNVRTEYNNISKNLDIECAKYEEISNSINSLNQQKQNLENNRLRSKIKLETRLGACDQEIESQQSKLDSAEIIDISEFTSKINRIDSILEELNTKIQKIVSMKSKSQAMIEMQHEKYNKMCSDHDQCPVCLNKLDESHKDYIEEEKRTVNQQIDELAVKKKSADNKLKEANTIRTTLMSKKSKLNDKKTAADIQKSNIENIKQRLKQLKSLHQDITDDLKSVENIDTTLDENIKDVTTRLDATQKQIDEIKEELSKLDVIKFIVSEEGVKSYIVKKILQLLNSKLSHYLKKMDSNCICVFNEYFEEEIIDEKGKQCSYFNFSGAERKNIDLACLFAFMDIRRLQGDVAFNFSMYDELFDSSLDERGVELVIDILKEKIEKYNECIMVISHRKESTKMATGEIIFLEKQNGITTRVATPETELK